MIQIKNLRKDYHDTCAVKDLNLEIEKGTVFGLIGSNGAGKTTTMKILATLVRPTAGQAWVDGYEVTQSGQKVRERIGYMPDFFGIYDQLTAMEYLDFYAACYGYKPETRRRIALELLELVHLTDQCEHEVDHLSRGMKQRLGLARALVHDPAYLILDEPASGLDPRARMEFREIIKELRARGKTILISSHILPELADICDVIGIMEQGELVACEPIATLREKLGSERIFEIQLLDQVDKAAQLLESHQDVHSVKVENQKIVVKAKLDEQGQVQLFNWLAEQQIPVLQFQELSVRLEDLFLQLTDKSKGGKTDEEKDERVDESSSH